MSVYERSWERDDARRREALPELRNSESDIERWARTGTYTPPAPAQRTRASRQASAVPPLLLGFGLVAAALVLVVICLFISGAITISYVPGS